MSWGLFALCVSSLVYVGNSAMFGRIPAKTVISDTNAHTIHGANMNYTTRYIEQPIDHFEYSNQDTFQMRYLINDQYWEPMQGPIFFYCGNEGDIAWFAINTGIMWEWAVEFKALLVFGEHRYYGESMPYGKDSYKDVKHLGYLTSEQALGDFAQLLTHLKRTIRGAADIPVIAFGGSYGGMLATWFRMKYPHVVHGSLAASAPIWMFGDLTPCDTFSRIVTRDFQKASQYCADNVRQSWSILNKYSQSDMGRKLLTQTFSLCSPLKTPDDVDTLKNWLIDVYGNLAMVDYPYPANFLEPLPAWPINAVCQYLNMTNITNDQLLQGLSSAVGVYYNYTGTAKCLDINQQAVKDLGDLGWDFQACSEMIMPICSTGKDDMFEPNPYNVTAFTDYCRTRWGVVSRPDWAITVYGGKDLSQLTNVIFSNGGLDPWSGGGVLTDLSPSLKSIFIPSGAHHIDLRATHPDDPVDVTEARQKEKQIVNDWIQDYRLKTDPSLRMDKSFLNYIWSVGSYDQVLDDDRLVRSNVNTVLISTFVLLACVLLYILCYPSQLRVTIARPKVLPVHITYSDNVKKPKL